MIFKNIVSTYGVGCLSLGLGGTCTETFTVSNVVVASSGGNVSKSIFKFSWWEKKIMRLMISQIQVLS